ncbi:hypothetical protein ARMGADRAFT_565548 [Armillaria gallica]|uniref:Uncharacterized protein n=1 Tax=Armillaria gallica TaxID=47427 RepID=A0A2H3DCI1_ARMGA|nr:hypothetical protein ARMGADRAFT_565548 [Armillaria gallica]
MWIPAPYFKNNHDGLVIFNSCAELRMPYHNARSVGCPALSESRTSSTMWLVFIILTAVIRGLRVNLSCASTLLFSCPHRLGMYVGSLFIEPASAMPIYPPSHSSRSLSPSISSPYLSRANVAKKFLRGVNSFFVALPGCISRELEEFRR